MKDSLNLIVMLTHNDQTVTDASTLFDQHKNAKVSCWGFKEKPLPLEEMKALIAKMKKNGKTTVMELVVYSEKEGLAGAKVAVECGVDILMGTVFHDSINEFCKENHLKYMPFVGQVTERPSILNGTVEEMIKQANSYIAKGAYGIDLLGYRYTGDAFELSKRLVAEVNGPVCLAGSIDSYERLNEVKMINPWAFTCGSAFFEKKFGDSLEEQINAMATYVEK